MTQVIRRGILFADVSCITYVIGTHKKDRQRFVLVSVLLYDATRIRFGRRRWFTADIWLRNWRDVLGNGRF